MRNSQSVFWATTVLWLALSPNSFGDDNASPLPAPVSGVVPGADTSAYTAPAPASPGTSTRNNPDTVQEEIVRLTKHIEVGEEEHKLSNKVAIKFKNEEEKLICTENNLRDHAEKKSMGAKEARLKDKLVKIDSKVQAIRGAPGYTE